ncbi:MAG: hypothetical protein VX218_08775 [Pseudomonadota bacterium]|nr:hypothetical protein [Pseudomonadota bacterium]
MQNDVGAALAAIEGRFAMPFIWGSDANDCISAMAAVVRAHSGYDPIAGLEWSNQAEGEALIASLGGLEAAISSRMTEIEPAMAQRFDAALVALPEGHAVMIVEGDSLVGPGPRRQMRLPRRRMLKAWTARRHG